MFNILKKERRGLDMYVYVKDSQTGFYGWYHLVPFELPPVEELSEVEDTS